VETAIVVSKGEASADLGTCLITVVGSKLRLWR